MASYIDFRYPGAFNLNQQATLPKIAVPDVASMFQTGLSAIADPIAARLKEDTTRARTAQEAAARISAWGNIYNRTQQGDGTTTTAAPAPAPRNPTVAGSPAGDDTGGPQGGGVGVRRADSSAVRDTFMETVKTGGLTNPFGLAAVAATGDSESSWSPNRATSSWNDKGKPSGGLLSWRDSGPGSNRLSAMRAFTAGAEDPVTGQAQFFLQENPRLIAALNAAKSPEEANQLMANAWRYEGFRGGDEYYKREDLTRQYATSFAKPAEAPAPAPATAYAPPVSPAVMPTTAQAGGSAPMNAATGRPMAPTDPALVNAATAEYDRVHGAAQAQTPAPEIPVRRVPTTRERAIEYEGDPPAPQAAAPQAAPVQVASLDPRISPAMPGLTLSDAVPLPPRRPPELTPAPQAPPTSAVPPSSATGAPSAAPAGPRPPASPAGVSPIPAEYAQAQGLPPVVSPNNQRGLQIDPRAARELLRTARTPEEADAIGQFLLKNAQPPAQSNDRFQIIHDAQGNWVRLDRLTGQTTPMPVQGGQREWEDLSVDPQKGISVQRNRRTGEVRVHGKPTTEVNVGKGENKEDEKLGEQRAEAQKLLREQADGAAQKLQTIQRVKSLLANVDSGKATPGRTTMALWGRALGVSDDTLKSIGLDPNKAADAAAIEALTGKFISDALAAKEFPSNNFSNPDRLFLQDQQPGIGKDQRTNRVLLEAMEVSARRQTEKVIAWRKYQVEQRKAGNARPDVFDFEDEWRSSLPSIFAKPAAPQQGGRRELAPGIWIEE